MAKQEIFCASYLLLTYKLIELRDRFNFQISQCFKQQSKEDSDPWTWRRRSSSTGKSSPRFSRSEEVGTTTNSTPSRSILIGSEVESHVRSPKSSSNSRCKRLSFQEDFVKTRSQRLSDASEPVSGPIIISAEVHPIKQEKEKPVITQQPKPKKDSLLTGPEKKEPQQTDPQIQKPEPDGSKEIKPQTSAPNQTKEPSANKPDSSKKRLSFESTEAAIKESNKDSNESATSPQEHVIDENTLKTLKLLASSRLVCSDARTRLIDELYEKFLSEQADNPPSPAPADPQLDDLTPTYTKDFKEFVPIPRGRFVLTFQNQQIVDSLREKLQPGRTKRDKNKCQRDSGQRLTSLPNFRPRLSHRAYSTYSDNVLPNKYETKVIDSKTYILVGPDSSARDRPHLQVGDCRPHAVHYAPPFYDPRLEEYDIEAFEFPGSFEQDNKEEIDELEQILREDVKYRKHNAKSFLNPSPELPGNFKQLLEDALRDRSSEPCLRGPFNFNYPKLGGTPRSQSPVNYGTTNRRDRSSERPTMGRMNSLEEHERKIIIEFCHLLEKSKQLFNGLRELPQYGHKQWHAYFGKTFDVYTKLWKFQQQHRAILDSKYGLKRWQIGEIASKIGQLYYHFYLRTSDTAFLNEAFSFYYAIRGRSYYTQACKEDKCELMVKKLRYYARFIVASLLLKKVHLVGELLRELDKQIVEYGKAYEPEDQNEWRIVADEVRTFIEVESVVEVTHPREYPCILSHRLAAPVGPSAQSAAERVSPMTMMLREAVIVGSSSTQLKFSELSIDMFRIMQTLEREPHTDINHLYDESPRQRNPPTPSAINNKGYNLDGSYNTGEAPHKQMLFKPSPNQIFLYMSSAIDDLPPNGVVLLYLSAEGFIVPNSKHPEEAGGYEAGGLITTSKADIVQRETSTSKDKSSKKESAVLYPGDLYPFTRRPLIVIVDSDNSNIFSNVPRHFGQPLIILMSPIEMPPTLYPGSDHPRTEGSLFTLFLHDPLSAICLCCDIKRMTLDEWERAQSIIDGYLKEAASLLSRMQNVYASFLSDDFLRLLILRYIFCETVLRMHRMFRGRAQRTRCLPTLPDDLFEHPILTRIVMELAMKLQVRGHFHDPAAVQRE